MTPPSQGVISVFDPSLLDFERHNLVTILVLATSRDLYDVAEVRVHLKDANDNAPVFDRRVYRTKVWEGVEVGSYVTQVSGLSS